MSWDSKWEDIHQSRPWGAYPSEPLVRFVCNNMLTRAAGNELYILEIGCGTGANLWFLAREGINTYGVDGSRTAVKSANKKLDSEVNNWQGEVVVADAVSLHFDDNMFDAVVDLEAVTHNNFKNSQRIYQEAHRVLKPGGMVFSQTFATGTWGEGIGEQVEEFGWIVDDGPLGLGEFIRFTPEHHILPLMAPFENVEWEKMSRTYAQRTQALHEWIITGTKEG